MSKNLEISKVLTVSTSHITEEVAKQLDRESKTNEYALSVYNKDDYGWWICVPEDCKSVCGHIPSCLRKLIELATTNDCNWLCIDCDGPEVDGLETYSW